VSGDVVRIGVFVGFSRIFLLWILIFKELTARRLYKSFGVKGLILRTDLALIFSLCSAAIFLQALL
jgi:hypothetical protein